MLSLGVYVWTLALLVSFGWLAVWVLLRQDWLGNIANLLISLPLVVPPIALGFFLLELLGRTGVLGSWLVDFGIVFIFDFKGLVLASFVASLPLFAKPIAAAIMGVDRSLIEASYCCGKGRISTALWVILPSIRSVLAETLFLASVRSFAEVGMSLLLGGNIIGRTDTLSLAVYNAVLDSKPLRAWVLAGVLALLSLVFVFVFKFIFKH